MSGHKRATVKLNQQDLYRLEQLGERVKQVELDYQDIQTKIHQHRSEQINQINQQLENRQNQYNQVLDGYQNDICRLEQATSQALLENHLALQDELENHQSVLACNMQTLIAQHQQSIHQVLQENQQTQANHFQSIKHALQNFQNEREQKAYLAQEAVQGAFSLLQSVNQVYPHERYFPGAMNRIQMEYDLAAQNLENGLAEAALYGAQQVCQQVSILRLSLEEIMQNTALMLSIAREKATEILLLIQEHTSIPAVDLEGNLLDTLIDVDYWSAGRLGSLYQRCAGFLNQLENPAADYEYADLERVIQLVLPQLEQSLQDIVAQARLKVILSQIRYNIAQRIVEALAEQGFEIQQSLYLGNDEKQPYQVITRNLEGSEVQVCVDTGDQLGAYQIQLDSEEAVPCTEAELRQRAHQVMRSLQTFGLKVGQIQELAHSQKAPFIVQSPRKMHTTIPGMTSYVH